MENGEISGRAPTMNAQPPSSCWLLTQPVQIPVAYVGLYLDPVLQRIRVPAGPGYVFKRYTTVFNEVDHAATRQCPFPVRQGFPVLLATQLPGGEENALWNAWSK